MLGGFVGLMEGAWNTEEEGGLIGEEFGEVLFMGVLCFKLRSFVLIFVWYLGGRGLELEDVLLFFCRGEWGESESSESDDEWVDLIIAVIMVLVIVPKKPKPKAVITEICFFKKISKQWTSGKY